MSDIGGKRGRVRKYERYLLDGYWITSEDAIKAYQAAPKSIEKLGVWARPFVAPTRL